MTTSRPRRRPLPLGLAVLLLLALGAAVTVFWFEKTRGGPVLRDRLERVPLLLLLLALLTLANLLLRWLRWHFLTRRLDVMIRARESLRLYFATLLSFATPFYVGELVRGFLLSRRYPTLRPAIFPIWLVERGSDTLALALFAAWGSGHPGIACLLGAALTLLVLVFAPARRHMADPRLVRWPSHLALLAALPVLSLAAWVLPALGLAAVVSALGGKATLATSMLAFSRGTLLGGLTGLPLGTGVSGSATIVALADHGVPAGVATASVALLRAGTTWFAAVVGAFILVRSWRFLAALLRESRTTHAHFDEIAPEYARQIPQHMQGHLLERKVTLVRRHLQEQGIREGSVGLDLGCGQGWYLLELEAHGYAMVGADAALGQVENAHRFATERKGAARLLVADALHLPFASGKFDFVYSINMFHHLKDAEQQRGVFAEVVRVLKPGGTLFLHEINVENPLFRFYMSYVFPLVRSIDEGNECWLRVSTLPLVDGASWRNPVEYFTFAPDFLPRPLLRLFAPLERRLEGSFLRVYAAHYMARLTKAGALEARA